MLIYRGYDKRPTRVDRVNFSHAQLQNCVGLWLSVWPGHWVNVLDGSLINNIEDGAFVRDPGVRNTDAIRATTTGRIGGIWNGGHIFQGDHLIVARIFRTTSITSYILGMGSVSDFWFRMIMGSQNRAQWDNDIAVTTVNYSTPPANRWIDIVVRCSTNTYYGHTLELDEPLSADVASVPAGSGFSANRDIRIPGDIPDIAGNFAAPNRIAFAAMFDADISENQLRAVRDNPWAPLERRIWVPREIGAPGPVVLNINDLRHSRPVDQVDVQIQLPISIDIEALTHSRAIDSIALSALHAFFVSGLTHARAVDEPLLIPTEQIQTDDLQHARIVDIVDLTALTGVVLDVGDIRHLRTVDSLLLDVEAPIVIESLRHSRLVDQVDLQPLLGDQTGMGATASAWVLDAGQALTNAANVDFSYHVLEGVFDSAGSVLGVDGARVTGSAGMRELTTLTFGADVDGNRRVQGEIAELRIYDGALSTAQRDAILSELQTKWITG